MVECQRCWKCLRDKYVQELQKVKNGKSSEQNNYGLLLNIDWLQPYHVAYSVGVI